MDLINTDRYPIHREVEMREALVRQCRKSLQEEALCALPGFLTAEAVQQIAREITSLSGEAKFNPHLRSPFPWMNNSGFPPGHPRSALFLRRFDYLMRHQFPENSLLLRLFKSEELTAFVRDALGQKTLYNSACPTLSVQVNLMNEGDVLPWHYVSGQ